MVWLYLYLILQIIEIEDGLPKGSEQTHLGLGLFLLYHHISSSSLKSYLCKKKKILYYQIYLFNLFKF